MSPSIGIQVRVEHPNVDGLLDTQGGLLIFPVENLFTLHGDMDDTNRVKGKITCHMGT